MIRNFITANALKLAGGIILALILFSGFQMLRAARWETSSVRFEGELKLERQDHAVTRASNTTLRAAIAADNAEDEARAASLAQARQDAAVSRERLSTQYRSTQARIDALTRRVGQNAGDCTVPEEVTDALTGL